MTTYTDATALGHANDADFQAWVDVNQGLLVGAGLIQTADTGQLAHPCVAARPATSNYAGYRIWRMNDTLQATAPVFFKLEYGTHTSVGIPALRVTFGTGSDGSGAITDVFYAAHIMAIGTSTVAGTFTNYACHAEGGFFFAQGSMSVTSATRARFFLGFSRTVNAAGDWTAAGGLVCFHGLGSNRGSYLFTQSVAFGPTVAFSRVPVADGGSSTSHNNTFWLPGSETGTAVGADTQVMPAIATIPAFTMVPAFGCALLAELTLGSTASITFIGASPKTYIQMSHNGNQTGARRTDADDQGVGLLCLWE